jgi:hypothetical protein
MNSTDEEVGEDETSLWFSTLISCFSISCIVVESKEYSSTHPCNCASIKKSTTKKQFFSNPTSEKFNIFPFFLDFTQHITNWCKSLQNNFLLWDLQHKSKPKNTNNHKNHEEMEELLHALWKSSQSSSITRKIDFSTCNLLLVRI